MPNKLIILLLIEAYFFIDFEIQNEQIKIMPNTENKLNPFQITHFENQKNQTKNDTQNNEEKNQQTNEDVQNQIFLELQCGKDFNQSFQLTFKDKIVSVDNDNNILKDFYSFDSLNEFLSQITISILKGSTRNNTSINYKIKYEQNKTYEIYQKILVYKEIPIYLKNTTLSNDNIETGKFQQQVLNIEEEYLSKTNPDSLEVQKQSNNFPDWLSFMIKDSILVFYGAYPEKQLENIVVNFKIYDKDSGLSSQNIDFWILKNYEQGSKSMFKLFTILFVILFMLVISLFLYLLFRFVQKRQKQEQLKKSIQGHNMRRQESSSYQGATVLSQSILQWNKQLVVYHREKSKTPDKKRKSNKNNRRNSDKNYEDFDQQFSFDEHSDYIDDIEDIKDISKIDASNEQNIEKSSFLSGIKINQMKKANLLKAYINLNI